VKPIETFAERRARIAALKRQGTPPGQTDVADDLLIDIERFDRVEAELRAKHPDMPRDELVSLVHERLNAAPP
jgi:hypothetical protein